MRLGAGLPRPMGLGPCYTAPRPAPLERVKTKPAARAVECIGRHYVHPRTGVKRICSFDGVRFASETPCYTGRVFRDKPRAFLALPFKKSSQLYQQIGSALADSGIEPILPEGAAPGAVLSEHVQSAIRGADVVVADVTGKNANVFFEVGVAFGLGKPVLLLSQESLTDVPFDLRAHQIAVYRPEDVGTVRRYVELWLRDVFAHQQSAS